MLHTQSRRGTALERIESKDSHLVMVFALFHRKTGWASLCFCKIIIMWRQRPCGLTEGVDKKSLCCLDSPDRLRGFNECVK